MIATRTRIDSQYLWVDAVVTGDLPSEVEVISHQIASPFAAEHQVHAHIERSAAHTGRWDIVVNSTIAGAAEAVSGLDGLHVGEAVYRAVHRDVMAAAHGDGWTRLHAALVDCGDVRIAIAGHSGAGKTTLALALALRGAKLRGDEGVFIKGDHSVGLPRRVHVKEGTLPVLPVLQQFPLLHLPYAPPIWALDPTAVSGPLDPDTAVRPIDALVILDGWTDDATALRPMPRERALQALAEESSLWSEDYGLTLRNTSALLSATPCYSLSRQVGDSGVSAIEQLAQASAGLRCR